MNDFDITSYKNKISCGEIIRYKGLLLQPINMRHFSDYLECIKIFQIDKNKYIEYVQMSELEFILHLCSDINLCYLFLRLMNLCTNYEADDISFKYEGKRKLYLYLGDNKFDKKDFENIKRLICYQNIPDYDDEYIDPDFKQALEDAKELMYKNSPKINMGNRISGVMTITGLTYDEIMDMAIIGFFDLFDKSSQYPDWNIMKRASLQPGVKFKNKIPHWLFRDKNMEYESIITSTQDIGEITDSDAEKIISNNTNIK